MSTISVPVNLWVVGAILIVIGIIIIAIPFTAWTDGAVSDRLPDIVGIVLFVIGIIFVIIWAIFYLWKHH